LVLLEYFEKSSIFKAELQAAYAWLAKPAAKATTADERILSVVRYGERMYGSHDFQSRPSRIRINKMIRTIARTAFYYQRAAPKLYSSVAQGLVA
jgi:hypothetical protein